MLSGAAGAAAAFPRGLTSMGSLVLHVCARAGGVGGWGGGGWGAHGYHSRKDEGSHPTRHHSTARPYRSEDAATNQRPLTGRAPSRSTAELLKRLLQFLLVFEMPRKTDGRFVQLIKVPHWYLVSPRL